MFQLRLDAGCEVMFDGDTFLEQLAASGHAAWSAELREHARQVFQQHGKLPRWKRILASLPQLKVLRTDFQGPAVSFQGECTPRQESQLRDALRALHPWRKGPFQLFDVELDAEWRSDWKWQRVRPHIDLVGKDVLDVGCGNGYYGWRMLAAGAKRVVGLEPYALYNVQHAVFKQYAANLPHYVVPGHDQLIPEQLAMFDTVFSMGVFYHCRHPIGHLEALRRALKPNGEVILETLVVDGDESTMLVPAARYAKMRNVWCIPSTAMLCRLLQRTGFVEPKVLDVTVTSTAEQRATAWMTFESLADFLDPHDAGRTIEGYPRPQRAVVGARHG